MGSVQPDGVFCPPSGIYFRLENPYWDYSIFARDTFPPYTGTTWTASEIYGDQMWELVPADGDYVVDETKFEAHGVYALKNKTTRKYMRAHVEDNQWADTTPVLDHKCLLKLEASKHGNYPGHCKIVFTTPTSAEKLWVRGWLRCNQDGFWTPEKDADQDREDAFWSMRFDETDLVFESIEFHGNERKVANETKDKTLFTQIYTNNSNSTPNYDIEMNSETVVVHSFSHKEGFSYKYTMSAKIAFPADLLPLSVEGKHELGASVELNTNDTNTTKKTYNFKQSLRVLPWSEYKASMSIDTGKVEVPYTMTFKSRKTGAKCMSKGIWTGVDGWNLRCKIDQLSPKKGESNSQNWSINLGKDDTVTPPPRSPVEEKAEPMDQ